MRKLRGLFAKFSLLGWVAFFSPIIIFIAILVFLAGIVLFGGVLDDNNCSTNSNRTSTSVATASGGSAGSWTHKGTAPYKNAKMIWNFFKSKGFSGGSIAGILGCVNAEGGFTIPDRAEGRLGDKSSVEATEKYAGMSQNNMPISAGNYSDGNAGGGWFQFTPFHKYAPLGSSKWTDKKYMLNWTWTSYSGAKINHGIKNFSRLKWLANAPTPTEGAARWYYAMEMGVPIDSTHAAQRDPGAKTAYKLFGGSNIHFNSALLGAGGAADAGSAAGSSSSSSGCSSSNSNLPASTDLIKEAKRWLGDFPYSQPNRSANWKHPSKKQHEDCSGFVWLMLKRTGYKAPAAQWATPEMESDAKGPHHYLKRVSDADAKPGDIVIVNKAGGSGDDGHTAILLTKWHGDNNKTSVIEEGGYSDHVVTGGFAQSFYPDLRGGRITLARPIKK